MTAYQLIDVMQKKGVQLWLDGEMLRYDGPAGALSDKDLNQLRQHKASIVAFLRQAAASHGRPQLVRQPRDEDIPLSWSQQRLWFIEQLEGGAAVYHICGAVRLHGVLDREALQRTLDTIVERHEVLRTVFEAPLVEPVQVIGREARFALRDVDLQGYPPQEREVQVRLHGAQEAQERFDLSRGPLIRGRLLRVREQEHVLLVTMHHIVSDGWSMGILVREVGLLYGAYLQGRENPLPALPIQYADYAVWQRRWLQGEVLQGQLRYWKEQLSGAPAVLELPLERSRPTVQSYRGGSVVLQLDEQLSAALRRLSKQQDATLYMTLYAGFTVLLSRLSGQGDVVVGVPVANRQRTEVEGLIGFFVNTLALRVRVPEEQSVAQFLQQVKELTLSGYAHQEVPFEQVVEALQPPRSLSHSAVFQVMLVLQNTPHSELRLPGLRLAAQALPNVAAQFDVVLMFQEVGERIEGVINYASDLFDASTIQRWGEHLKVVLAGMARDANVPVGELELLDEGGRRQVLEQFNATQADYARERLVHELFEEQVRCTPGASAVVYEDRQLTYEQLNARANQLARHLRSCGVGPEQLVGLCMERSEQMMVGLLGILKAGAAYVPLDPQYPPARLQYMLEDSAAAVVVTQRRLTERLSGTQRRLIALDDEWQVIARHAHHDLRRDETGAQPHHLAYVIYTSGSTGQPKGVMVEHRGICNLVSAQIGTFGITPHSRVLQYASISFDAAVSEVMTTLCCGATLCVAPSDALLPGEPLLQLLSDHNITHATLPPAAVSLLPPVSRRDVLTTLIVAGEACPQSLVKSWGPGRRLINAYGPTENTVCASMYVCDPREEGNPPIGRPMANVQIYILDERQRPAPIGVSGEIYIAGAGLARGYLKRETLTQERFLKNPFSRDAQARMYRTGDVGRWRPDGSIEYLGRNDHQLKIRGYRIEAGEIETQLRRYQGVTEAVVIARDDAGEKRLVAYVAGQQIHIEALREHLERVLPNYMIPATFVVLEQLPVTPTGKVDRERLAAAEGNTHAATAYEAPEGDVEERMAKIWQEKLIVARVGRHDDFFKLGGNSLDVVRVVAVCTREQINCSSRQVFELRTIAAISAQLCSEPQAEPDVVTDLSSFGPSQAAVRFNCLDTARALFMLPPAFGGAEAYFELVKRMGTDCPVILLENIEVHSRRPFPIEELVEFYGKVILSHAPGGPFALAGWSRGGMVAYALADYFERRSMPVRRLFLVDSGLPRTDREITLERVIANSGAQLDRQERAYLGAFVDEFLLGNRSQPVSAYGILFTSTQNSPIDAADDSTPFHRALGIWRRYMANVGIAFSTGDAGLPAFNGYESMLRRLDVVPVGVPHEQLLSSVALDCIAPRMRAGLLADVL